MSTTVNLSLLARGRGSIKKNGHERVDVIFEPEDYYSWAEDSNKLYTLPPLQPKQAFITPRTGRELHEVALPKTFITRKGALLLFSEDLALKGEEDDGENGQGRTHDGLGLKTVEDLTKSILSYGSPSSETVNLRFVKERRSWIGTRRIRPGFSARRYLSRLTRSFDDTFLEKLQTKGYISDKTLFQQSDILPHIKRRINDDLSYMPTPYRIMRQMLISPGLLSGYTFYRMESSSGLTEISEEEQSSPAVVRPLTGTVIIVGVEQPGADDMVKPVSYEDLSAQEKQNVLTDLLVKSTINHALQKQKELIEGSLKGDEDDKESGRGSSVDKKSVIQDFNMANAIKSYLDGQPEILSQPGDYNAAQSARDGGSDKRSQGSVNERLPGLQEPSQQNANESRINSRERIFNKTPLLPPIRPDDSGYPDVAMMPATPQLSNQSQAGSAPKAQSREPTLGLAQQRMTESPEEEEEAAWGADVNEMELLQDAVSASPERQKLIQKRGSGQSAGSQSRGPVLAAGSFLESSAENMKVPPGTVASSTGHATSWKGSQKSLISQAGKEERTTPGGTVIVVPGGGAISAEVSFTQQDEIIDAVTSANIEQTSDKAATEPPESETENQQAGQDETASGKSSLSERAATTERASEGTISSRPVSEQEVVSALTEHAHKIASAVLSHPGSGVDLIQDAQAAAELWLENTPVNQLSRSQSLQDVSQDERATQEMMTIRRGGARSANAHVAEYKELLKETLTTALSKATGSSQESIAKDLEVSEELVEALANQELDPEDIEIVQDEQGKSIIRTKTPSSHRSGSARSETSGGREDKQSVKGDAASVKDTGSTVGGRKSTMSKSGLSKRGSIAESMRSISARSKATADSGRVPGAMSAAPSGGEAAAGGGGDPLSMDVINYGQVDRPEAEKSEIIVRPEVTTVREAGPRRESKSSTKSEEEISDTKSTESKQSAKSKSSEAKSKNSLEDRDEFVVGKVEQKGELEKLYGQLESPVKSPESKPRKPSVPKVTKSPKKKTKKKKTKKDGSPEAKSPAKTPKSPTPPPPEPEKSPEKEPTPQPPSERSHSPTPSFKTESEVSEESMEFIIIRDEFPSPEPEPEIEVKSVLSVQSSIPQSATTYSDTDSDDSSALKMITDKDARAAKRAAQAAKRREQVERKRREREEQLRKEKEEAERQERLKLELEEERRKKEEERRLKRLREEEERRREEEDEQNRLRRAMQDAERERRQKEEYQRKLEEMKKRQAEEDRRRAELAAVKAAEEEERRRQEEEMMSKMAEQERLEYERKKREEEEERIRQEELERIRLEEEAKKAMEEAKRLAEEMARRQAEIEARLQFNRGLQLESHGLEHTQDVTRAFVFSYYELLQWLGLEVPEFERLKESLK